jgi:sigma-E factor negative regulatory protein RseC
MSSGTIIHPGIIQSISGETISVRILAQSACSSCHAKGMCAVSEVEEKIIEAHSGQTGQYQPGDQVMVRMEESLGMKAVFMGYVLPLIVLLVSIVVFLLLLKNEGLAALFSILMLVPYYLVLYLFRNKLQKKFRFSIQ